MEKKSTLNLLEKEKKANVLQIVKELRKKSFVKAIILFGSYANRKQTPLSDVDVCVITKKGLSWDKKAFIGSYSSKEIDVSLFWDLPLYIQYRVIKEGKLLFRRDKLELHRVKVNTILRYLDFKPLLDRHIEKVLSG